MTTSAPAGRVGVLVGMVAVVAAVGAVGTEPGEDFAAELAGRRVAPGVVPVPVAEVGTAAGTAFAVLEAGFGGSILAVEAALEAVQVESIPP